MMRKLLVSFLVIIRKFQVTAKILGFATLLPLTFTSNQLQAATSVGSITVSGTQSKSLIYGAGNSVTYNISLTLTGSGNGSTNLSINWNGVAPTGVGVTFSSSNPIYFNNSSPRQFPVILTVATTSNTPAGNYSFTVTESDRSNTSGSASFIVSKATPTATLSVSNSPVTYDGTAKAATVGITTSSVPGSVSNILTGGAASQITANTYAVLADFIPTDGNNYNTLTGLSAGNFVIQKATPTISVSGTQVFTYNGSSMGPATITYNGDGTTSLLYTNTSGTAYSSSIAPTNAGSYKVVASTTASTNYLAASSADYTFTINKATPTISVSGTQVFTYNGSSQGPATIVYNGDGTTSLLYTNTSGTAYSSSTAPANAGSYKVVASSTAGINYLAASSADYTFTINKATPTATLALNNSSVTYDGTAKAATVGITTSSVPGSVSNILTGGAASQITANTYAVLADFIPTDGNNYNTLTGLSVGNFVIQKASPTISVSGTQVFTYNGSSQGPATITYNGDGTTSLLYTNTSGTAYSSSIAPTNAGSYKVVASTTEGTNYLAASSADYTFTIDKATPTISVSGTQAFTYNGSSQGPATIVYNGDGTTSLLYTNTSGTAYSSSIAPTNAGSYKVVASATASTNYLAASSADYTFTINKATPAIRVSGTQAFTYNGSSQGPATITYNGDGTTSLLYTNTISTAYSSNTAPTNAGSYKVVASSTAGINYLAASSADYTFTINKATPTATLALNNSLVTYDGTAKAAIVGITTSSVPGSVSNILTGGAASQITANTYEVLADFIPTDGNNYNTLTGLSVGNFVINKATPTLSVTNSPVTYDGTAKSALVSCSVAGNVSNILTGGAANQTNAGTYAVTADFVPTDASNYRSLTAASAGNFVIDKAMPTLSVTNSPVTYNGSAQLATVSGTGGGTVSNIKYDGSSTVPTNAGTYAITADIAASTNYTAATGVSAGNFVITKIPLIITANNRSKCFGQTISFAGTEFTSSGLVGPDAVTSVTLYSDGAASSATPGNYPITPSVAAGSGLNNYTISYNNGTLTVNALPTITLGTSPSVCKGTTAANLPYSATSGSPNLYSIIYDATAHTAGFSDVSMTSLPATPISLAVPANASAGTYNGTIAVKNANGCLSTGTPFTVTIQDIDVSVTDASENSSPSCPDFYDFNGNTVGYKAGYSILKFRVTRSLSNAEWNFDYMLSGGNLYTGSPASSSGSRSVPNGSNAVDLEFYIANTPGSAQTIQFKVTNVGDANCSHNGINKTVIHTISAMPAIGSFN